MQKLLKCCFAIFIFSFLSCQDMGTARFIVYNKSSVKVDSLYFMPADSSTRTYLSLQPGEKQRYNLSMAGLSTDGAYGIYFKKGNEHVFQRFGYFSNGAAMEKYTEVEIMDDTLVIKPEY